jgi:hypothetical protein
VRAVKSVDTINTAHDALHAIKYGYKSDSSMTPKKVLDYASSANSVNIMVEASNKVDEAREAQKSNEQDGFIRAMEQSH